MITLTILSPTIDSAKCIVASGQAKQKFWIRAESDSGSDESLTLDVSTSAQKGTLISGVTKNAFPGVLQINNTTPEDDRTWVVEVCFADTVAAGDYTLTFGNASGLADGDPMATPVAHEFTLSDAGSDVYTHTVTQIKQLYLRGGIPYERLTMFEIPNRQAMPTAAAVVDPDVISVASETHTSGFASQELATTDTFTDESETTGDYLTYVQGKIQCDTTLGKEEECNVLFKMDTEEYPIETLLFYGGGQVRGFSGIALVEVTTGNELKLIVDCSSPLDLTVSFNMWFAKQGDPLVLS